jgi:hypothetical protein
VAVGVDVVRRDVEILKSCRNVLSIASVIIHVLSRNYDSNTQCIEAINHEASRLNTVM